MEGSVEYNVLVHHTADLLLAVKPNIISLGAQLVAGRIITPDQYNEIRNAHRPVNERGAMLVEYVQNKVRQDPRHYHAFIGALSDLSQYGDILKKLGKTMLPVMSAQPQPVFPQPPSREGGNQLTASVDTKCSVCLNLHVDPCTLSCGHTFCQLCLACMWKSSNKICPVCKETWKVLPAISYDYRRNIESAHDRKVEQLRQEYSQEDKELIESFLEAKRIFNLKLESLAQESEEKDMWKLPGVEECGEISVVVQSSQGQLVEWNGLKLHIHAGSLPEGLQQCTISIKASLAGDYEIPENTSLVSAVFWLRCEPQCTRFTKPITVEIQHCSTKRDLSKLKLVRAFCSQKLLPYKFKPLERGRFHADTSYGVIDVKGFSGYGVTEEKPDSERLYYNQLFYRSNPNQQKHDIYIIYTWNTDAHINYVSVKYPEEQGYSAGYYQVIELDGAVIQVDLDKRKWTEVMDSQWKLYPIKPLVTKAELDDFKVGRAIPNLVLEACPLYEDFPELLHQITLIGVKSPYNELTLRIYSSMPPRRDYSSGDSMATPRTTQLKLGYMCDFIEKPPQPLQCKCPICLLVLREPYQATCCGTSFCKECIHRIKATNQTCPTCRDKDFSLFLNKGLQRVLYDFQVHCTHKSNGCEWTGELRELDNHLNSDPPVEKALQGCPFTLIKCPLGCVGCEKGVRRKDIKSHVGDTNKQFSHVMTQSALRTEVDQLYQKVAEVETRLSEILALRQQSDGRITGTYKPVGAEFTMINFEELKRDNDRWYSPHFYTHPNGYKMCLRVDASGNASGQGTHLSVFVYLLQGEFDSQLKWPFQGNITIKLVNQEQDKDHVIETFYSRNAPSERCERVMTNERIENGWGTGRFLPLAKLQPKYLKNDCIKLCVKKIELY